MAVYTIPTTFEEILEMTGGADTAGSVGDALVLSKRNRGKVDLDYMESITGKSKDEILRELISHNAVYQNPEFWDGSPYSNWETADEYLSGNLHSKRNKIREYIAGCISEQIDNMKVSAGDTVTHRNYGEGEVIGFDASHKTIGVRFKSVGFKLFQYPGAFLENYLSIDFESSHIFDRNISAIDAVIPDSLSIGDINVRLGSPWLDPKFIDKFITWLFGPSYSCYLHPEKSATVHDSISGSWKIPKKSRYGVRDVNSTEIYGTPRMTALHILETLLNNAEILIYDYDKNNKATLNRDETVAAKRKADELESKFEEFVHLSSQTEYEVEQMYLNAFGSVRQRRFCGSIFDFPGMNPEVTLYEHQREAFSRCVLSPNTLLAHDVGAGKTYVMIAAAMELRRMGISQKNLFVVPNNILGQWAEFFSFIYPSSKVLIIGPDEFKPSKKNASLEKVRDGDYDAVLMAYSCFDRLSLSKNTLLEEAEEEFRVIQQAIKDNPQSVPGLNRLKTSVQKKIDRLIKEKNNPDTVYFDDLGINTLFIDEIHNYKNITVSSRSARRFGGAGKKGSAKNDAMLEKIHYVQKTNGGRGVIAATGTPVTNSITDLYALQLMLQSGELSLANINSFDEWIGAFAVREDSFELDVDTSKFRTASRYSFRNVPELASLFSSVADFFTVNEENLPSFDGYEEVVVPATAGMIAFNHAVSKRVDSIHKGTVERDKDNLLKVTIDCIKACVDLRLVNSNALFTPNCKIFYCARKIAEIYRETAAEKLTQLVFCDISTPKPGFNAYSELKRILTELGIPEDKIAFVHDATTDSARSKLFDDTRKGRIRILIGSTRKLGTGTNVQDKLVAIHHLDVPWTPADMNQREGRILRAGNTCEKVHIYRYITKDSFDAYSYQLLERKQKFISEILQGCVTEREGKDVDMLLTYAEIKSICIGDENLKKRFEAANELTRCRILKRKAAESRANMLAELEKLNDEIPRLDREVNLLKKDSGYASSQVFEGEKALREKVNGLIAAAAILGEYGEEELIYPLYHGFDIIRPSTVTEDDPYLIVAREGRYKVGLKASHENNIDPASRINNTLKALPTRLSNKAETLEKYRLRREQCKAELGKNDSYDEQIRHYDELVRYYDRLLEEAERKIS